MSSSYSMIPLAEFASNADGLAWLDRVGLSVPETEAAPSPMTPDGVRVALRGWQGRTVREYPHGDDMHLWLRAADAPEPTRDETCAQIAGYQQDHAGESVSHWLSFSYGAGEFLMAVAEHLSRLFGPIVLLDDQVWAVIVCPGRPWMRSGSEYSVPRNLRQGRVIQRSNNALHRTPPAALPVSLASAVSGSVCR